MKKYFKIIGFFLIIFLLAFSNLRKYYIKKDFEDYKVDLTNLNLQINEKEDCIKEKILYYEEDGIKYYTSCLNNITDNNGKDLKSLLDAGKITFADIFFTYQKELFSYDDGGSTEYYFDNLTILKCNTIGGNFDVIIGAPITSIHEGYCSEDFNKKDIGSCSFNKTYLVKEKKEKTDDGHTYIMVEDSKGNTAKVKVKDYVIKSLKFGKENVFTFDNTKELIKDDTIEDIFATYCLRSYGTKGDFLGAEETDQKVCMPVSKDLLKKAYLYLSKEKQKLIENYFLAETDYKKEKMITVYNENNKAKDYKNIEVIIVRFTKDVEQVPNVISVVIDFKTKEVLGTLLVN
ncbi:MAG: hypothetical protein PHX04_02410 [Bacilli bacterium]|nr:hypothetical protein [Bacilli bacterium]